VTAQILMRKLLNGPERRPRESRVEMSLSLSFALIAD
jgi:hypothetical protein